MTWLLAIKIVELQRALNDASNTLRAHAVPRGVLVNLFNSSAITNEGASERAFGDIGIDTCFAWSIQVTDEAFDLINKRLPKAKFSTPSTTEARDHRTTASQMRRYGSDTMAGIQAQSIRCIASLYIEMKPDCKHKAQSPR